MEEKRIFFRDILLSGITREMALVDSTQNADPSTKNADDSTD
jgi:hypothetical protein